MPAFAGFSSLKDYITTRLRQRGESERDLSAVLGRGHAYVHSVKAGRYQLDRDMADKIAYHFDDAPRVVRILAGLELPPTEENKTISAIKEIAASLPPAAQKDLLDYAEFLKNKHAS